ncbi:MAG TPA: hypothetical protein ENN53_00590 [Candidatus Acetothermia bacterium]|nr:hypothetical protein [Candidatus Acetothermia bacterium]
MSKSLIGAVVVATLVWWAGWAEAPAPVGTVGTEITFTAPGASSGATSLSLAFGQATVSSRTEFSRAGLDAEHLTLAVDWGGVTFGTGMTFNPCFSRYWFDVRGSCYLWCCPLGLGGLFLVENLAPVCQIPDYTMGIVLDLGTGYERGFFARSLTGFGVTNVWALIDLDPATFVAAAPGLWFEEELLHVGFTSDCFLADAAVLFDPFGFVWTEFGASYIYPEPEAELGVRSRLDASWLDWAKLFLGVRVPPVGVRLVTTFDLLGFVEQEVWVEVSFSWVRIYSRTRFDLGSFLQVTVGAEVSL